MDVVAKCLVKTPLLIIAGYEVWIGLKILEQGDVEVASCDDILIVTSAGFRI